MQRYSRQVIIEGFGEKSQRKLQRARVLVAGLGGLGSAASLYLAAAGVGHLVLVDDEEVEVSNLNRQVLHWARDLKKSKAESAAEKLRLLNPSIEVEAKKEKVTPANAGKLIGNCEAVVDGLDNYSTRYLLNEHCVRLGRPLVHGAVEGFVGQVTTILPGRGPCLKCIIPQEPATKKIIPVLGATSGVIGCLQAMETIKLLTGIGKPLVGRMLIFDGRTMSFEELEVNRNPSCPVCSPLCKTSGK
ncbi:MAG: HesA/MoeB/ThiF family protein [Candidatus Hadarchaeales archaeon]